MATSRSRRKRALTISPDEFGGLPDGGLAIVLDDETVVHRTPPRVAGSLRYFLAKTAPTGATDFPARLAITSALRGEGVTYTARSLASVMAYDNESSVVLVDLNWTTPSVDVDAPASTPTVESAAVPKPEGGRSTPRRSSKRRRGVEQSRVISETPTLIDAVGNDAKVDDILIATTNRRLALVNAGALHLSQRPVVAGSKALEEVIDEIAGRFDQVVLDLPSVLSSSDAIRLAHLANAYVLVVRYAATTTRQIDTAFGELRVYQSLGAIVNRYQSKVPPGLRRLLGA